jgi:hypothetical protein
VQLLQVQLRVVQLPLMMTLLPHHVRVIAVGSGYPRKKKASWTTSFAVSDSFNDSHDEKDPNPIHSGKPKYVFSIPAFKDIYIYFDLLRNPI